MKRSAAAPASLSPTVGLVQPTPALGASGHALPVSGTGSGATFTGTLALQKFVTTGGAIAAVGRLTGTLTDPLGGVTIVAKNAQAPVNIGAATCDILQLDIGPIAVDLLGLQVNLSEIMLDITAQAGEGSLLGYLLSIVAGLHDRPNGLVRALNDILGVIV